MLFSLARLQLTTPQLNFNLCFLFTASYEDLRVFKEREKANLTLAKLINPMIHVITLFLNLTILPTISTLTKGEVTEKEENEIKLFLRYFSVGLQGFLGN